MKEIYYLCRNFSERKICVVCICLLICMLQFSACNEVITTNQEVNEEQVNVKNRNTIRRLMQNEFPATNPEILSLQMQQEPDIICPLTAYVVATYELENGKYTMLQRLRNGSIYDENQVGECVFDPNAYHEWHLTERPRMILDFEGRVKYYEFGLIEQGEVTSIITVYAKREAPCAIAYMFPYVLPYDNVDYNYYIGNYPHRVFNDGVGYLAVEHNEIDTYQMFSEQTLLAALEEQLPSEDLEELNNMSIHALNRDIDYDSEVTAYWDAIDEVWIALGYDLPCIDDGSSVGGTAITIASNTYVQALKDYLGTNENYFDYTAVPYRSTQLQKTYWNCACGPAALAWMYRGLFNEYPVMSGAYLPIHGNTPRPYFGPNYYNISRYYYDLEYINEWCATSYLDVREEYIQRSMDVDNGLTGVFFDKCDFVKVSDTWQGILIPSRLGNAFLESTNSIYTVTCDCDALTAVDNIYYNNLPVLILWTWWQHYIIAYGYGCVTTSGCDIERSNLYFLIMDNGYTISAHNYSPYWRAYRPCEYYHCVVQN